MTTHLLQPDAAVLPHAVVIEPLIEVRDGVIHAVHAGTSIDRSVPRERIDGTLLPGLVDLQVNGAGGHNCDEESHEALDQIARTVAIGGAAAFLPTVITAPIDRLVGQIRCIADWIEKVDTNDPSLALPLGIHVEGPFLTNAGAHDKNAMVDPTPERVERILNAGRGHVRLVTLSPARAGAAAATERLRAASVTVSLGHGTGEDGIDECVAAGATMATHLFNAMGPSDHRDPGMSGHIMDYPALSCSLIVDGIHVHPARIRQAVKILGVPRTILVTDCIAAMGMADGEYRLADSTVTLRDGAVRNADGTLAGSALTMIDAVANFRAAAPDTGSWTLAQVAADNPARIIGDKRFGQITPGRLARFAVHEFDGSWRTLIVT